MGCLSNIDRINYPKELVYSLTNLYTFRGKDAHYEDVFKAHLAAIVKNTINKDTLYAIKLLNLNITDARMKAIIFKNSEPKTRDEKVAANLKNVFSIVQEKGEHFELTSNEILKLAETTFKDAVKVGYKQEMVETQVNLLTETRVRSKRLDIDDEFTQYKRAINDLHIEATQAATDLYVDLINLNCFNKFNDYISLLVLYCLLFKAEFKVFKYVSFFESYVNNKTQFEQATSFANHGWASGYPNTAPLNELIIKTLLDGYAHIENEVMKHEFDKNLKKVESVETIILKLDRVFTKEQVMKQCPTLSLSTINRALKRLKDEKKIQPNGTGRSASWVKLVEDEILASPKQQLSLFDLQEMNDGF